MLQRITHEIDEEVQEATQQALRDDAPAPGCALDHLYSDTVDPTSAGVRREPRFHGAPMTMVDLINATLREEMRRNPDIVVFGEDVADCSREANLARGQGQGRRVQSDRRTADGVRPGARFNTPLAEAAIVGPRHRHGDARAQARRGDPVLRLHLAGDDADSR